MLFNSMVFIYAFLPITYLVFWRLTTKTQRYVWLTATGYVFYGFWNWKFCFLMLTSTLISYFAGLGMLKFPDPRRRKIFLVLPVLADLLLLGIFKYTNFAIETTNYVAYWLSLPGDLPLLDIVLPVGISFYTFHTITYIVDAYRGIITPTRNFFEFSCYVSLFSQLVAGPIVRFRQIERDLENIDSAPRTRFLHLGISFFMIGLFKKVLLADTVAAVIDPALANYAELGTIEAWACMLGFTYQLYFDFSGYSDMAVGLGYLFGVHIPQNFNSPYKALDIADFWHRWHISLSTCLRDYLYIPMGGSRGGVGKTYRNLLITMLLGGIWHGASWTFVVWGAYHGILLSLNRVCGEPLQSVPAGIRRTVTFLLVVVGWVFFRSESFEMAWTLLGTMFSWVPALGMPGGGLLLGTLVVCGAISHTAPNSWQLKHQWTPVALAGMGVLYLVCLAVIYGGQQSPFLYFQF